MFGFTYTYLNNYLSSKSVTLATFVSSITLIIIMVTAFFINKDKKPTYKNVLGIVMAAIGILLINMF